MFLREGSGPDAALLDVVEHGDQVARAFGPAAQVSTR